MATAQELAVRDKKELVSKEEKTVPGRYYVPYADIYETDDSLSVVMEMPGVEKNKLTVALENGVLRVDGQIDFSKYEEMEPVYTEYNVGHYTRSFTLSNKIDQEKISAQLEDGVLTLTLPKAKEAQPRRFSSGLSAGGRWRDHRPFSKCPNGRVRSKAAVRHSRDIGRP
jgi:HSP20 family molecular chaperone IbpA